MRELLTWKAVGWVVATIILPAAISAFGPEIRRFLDVLRGKPRQWRLARLKYKLCLLERLHNSPYNLLLHLAWNLVYVSQFLAAYAFVFVIIKLFKPDVVFTVPGTVLSAVSAVFGRVLGLADTVYALYDFDRETGKLRAKIERLEKPTAKAATSPIG